MQALGLGPFVRAQGTVRLPGSKSISNRVLLLAALAAGETEVAGLLDADDTRVMREALVALGHPRVGRVEILQALLPLQEWGARILPVLHDPARRRCERLEPVHDFNGRIGRGIVDH